MSDADVTALLGRWLERLSLDGEDVLETLCAEHPEQAEELRRRRARLLALGLAGEPADTRAGGLPRTIGPFTVVAELGRGGMGRVYLAQQTTPVRRLVAVKLLHAGLDAERLVRRFETERQSLAVLSHPGIAQVFEAGATDDGRPWYAMEYVDGLAITDACDERALDLDARLDVFLQVCDAVTHAHQSGILHRDLKPTNVLVCERDGRAVVKVIDFGLAKEIDEARGDGLTLAGQIVGTPAYMSPEQAGVTEHRVDLRTDVYALGVLLYELLVGELPLEPGRGDAGAQLTTMQRLLRDVEPIAPSRRVADVPAALAERRGVDRRRWTRALVGDLDWIVAKAMHKEPGRRYASVSELAADVRRHRRHEPVSAGPPSAVYSLGRFVRRHRREVGIAALGLLALMVALVVISLQAGRLSRELDNFDVLQSENEIAELRRRAELELWPEHPDLVPAMERWRADARTLLAQRDRFERVVAALRARGAATPAGPAFEAERDRYLHEHVVRLLAELDALQAPDGLIAAVDARLAWAASLERRTIDEHAERWRAAIDEIADVERSPHYRGLRLVPQLGLVPLARDAGSGLWEFAFPRPNAAPPTRVDGRWRIDDDTCLVFVLIPGGAFRQGLQDDDPDAPDHFPNVAYAERHGREITLAPFFLSKYEMTQGQWLRFTGDAPSHHRPGTPRVSGLAHPVEQVSWLDAERVLGQLGLQLPTGAQWEYAARAGARTPWWTGAAATPPPGVGNLADESCLASLGRDSGIDVFELDYDDGFAIHAPVGRLAPNPFGLHDVIGNVWEWCRDVTFDYEDARPRAGDGLQQPLAPAAAPTIRTRELRGGSFLSTFSRARSTFRLYQTQDDANFVFGVRPARAIVASD